MNPGSVTVKVLQVKTSVRADNALCSNGRNWLALIALKVSVLANGESFVVNLCLKQACVSFSETVFVQVAVYSELARLARCFACPILFKVITSGCSTAPALRAYARQFVSSALSESLREVYRQCAAYKLRLNRTLYMKSFQWFS